MLGFRGASRYIAPEFQDCFELECQALKRVRDVTRLTNVEIMIPFVRTVSEAKQVVALLEQNGLARGANGLRLIMMCEIPSNASLADRFLEHFDGFSIGSNDMTQLTLAVDRDWAARSPPRSTSATTPSRRCSHWPSARVAKRASTAGSAARDRQTIPISPSG